MHAEKSKRILTWISWSQKYLNLSRKHENMKARKKQKSFRVFPLSCFRDSLLNFVPEIMQILQFKAKLIGFKKEIVFAVGIIGLGMSVVGCVAPSPEHVAEKEISPSYTVETQPIKPEECGQCHPRFFNLIKTEGGKHRIDCKQCHVRFHIYRPGKVQYEEVLPKCSACHDEVHGADLALCSECHTDAHTPLNIPAQRALEEGCHICHAEVDSEMKTYITQHTELHCISCHHTRHRYVPECIECHRPHAAWMNQDDCLGCHPPHKARQVVYAQDTPSKSCAICHRNAYAMLKQSDKKHTALSCTKCHPEKHRTIMRCRECHGEPHPADMHKKFRVCGQCHGIAHFLAR